MTDARQDLRSYCHKLFRTGYTGSVLAQVVESVFSLCYRKNLKYSRNEGRYEFINKF